MNPKVGNGRNAQKHEDGDLANVGNHFHAIFNSCMRFATDIVLDVRHHREGTEDDGLIFFNFFEIF